MYFKVVILTVFMLTMGTPIVAQTCLDYWSVGTSGCNGKNMQIKDESFEDAEKTPANKEEIKTKALDERINDYLQSYDKPPREFVAWTLEPTVENAVKWVQKFDEIQKRNKQMTAAWAQARALYEQAQEQGMELPELKTSLPDIPDYGVEISPAYDSFRKSSSIGQIPANNSIKSKPTGSSAISFSSTPLIGGSIMSASPSASPIHIYYFFSAFCPFCKKFEPEFQKLINELGKDRLRVTCVDITPGPPENMKIENVLGKIDCAWRPVMPGEMTKFGVTSTPTLIINRPSSKKLERISGLTDINKIKRFLLGGN